MSLEITAPESIESTGNKKIDRQRSGTHERVMHVLKTTGNIAAKGAKITGFAAGATIKTGIQLVRGAMKGLAV